MDSREYHHRLLVRVGISNLLVHVEEVTVTLTYYILAKTLDSILEIEEHGKTGVVYAEALVATLFCCT